MVRLPVLTLTALTAISFVVSLITASMSRSAAEDASSFGGNNVEALASSARLAIASNAFLIWAGVGVIALLVVWSVKRAVDSRF